MKDKKIPRRKFLKQTAAVSAMLPFVPRIVRGAQNKPPDGGNVGSRSLVLWYNKPAGQWVEAAPVGNGRIGAMVFGGVPLERLQLNEDTLYAGGPYDPNNRQALQALPEARRLIFDGEYRQGHGIVGAWMIATLLKQMSYQPVGDFSVVFAGYN